MKISKLILPITLLFALTGCGNSEPVAEGGNIPSGGQAVADKEQAEQTLEDLVEKSSASLKENDAFGFTVTNKGVSVKANATRFNLDGGVSEFTLNGGATGLYSGTKETTKMGATFSGTKVTYKLDAVPEEGDETHIDKNYEIGPIGTYFDNGSIYVDASEAKLGALIQSVLTDASPSINIAVEQYLGPDTAAAVATLLATLTSSEAAVTAFIGATFFNKALGFNYKMAFKDVVKDEDAYPLIKVDETTTETAKEKVSELKEIFEQSTGLAWDDVMTIYTYKAGGKALQFELNKDQILAMIQPEDVEAYGIEFETASVKAAVYFNEQGVPTTASLKEEIKGSANGDIFVDALGSALTFESVGEIDINLTYGSNPVSFPENYDDYNAFKMADLSSLLG